MGAKSLGDGAQEVPCGKERSKKNISFFTLGGEDGDATAKSAVAEGAELCVRGTSTECSYQGENTCVSRVGTGDSTYLGLSLIHISEPTRPY